MGGAKKPLLGINQKGPNESLQMVEFEVGTDSLETLM
jgi:hypothetical protein